MSAQHLEAKAKFLSKKANREGVGKKRKDMIDLMLESRLDASRRENKKKRAGTSTISTRLRMIRNSEY